MEKEVMSSSLAKKSNYDFRRIFMVVILLSTTAAEILIDYVKVGFDASIFADVSYWIKLIVTCLSIVLITLTVRDFFREKELTSNKYITKTQEDIDVSRVELFKHNLATRFEEYVNGINAERKLKAYMEYLQFKMSKAKKAKKRTHYQELLKTAEGDISFIPTRNGRIKVGYFKWAKFNQIRISTLFSRSKLKKNGDESIEDNENIHVNELIFKKLLILVTFSLTISTLLFDTGTFATAILINTFSKLFRIATSMYLGAADGQAFVKGTLLTKMKLRLDFVQKFLEKEKAGKLAEASIEEEK